MAENIFGKIRRFFKKSFFAVGASGAYESGVYGNNDYLDAYEASFLVNGCVNKIADAVATQQLRLYSISGRYGQEMEAKEVLDSDLLDLLEAPNQYISWYDLMFGTVACLKLMGNAYWYKVRGAKGQVEQLWPLRPDCTQAVISKDGKTIEGFNYTLGGSTQRFAYEDVVHFKYYNPKDDLNGLATIKPVMEVVKTSIYSTRWNKNFFYNSAMPDALIVLKNSPNLTDEERKEILGQWNNKYKGANNAHKIGLVEGDIDIKILSQTAKDMDFANMRVATRDDILSAFGVPKPIMAVTDDVNRANAETAVWIFLSQTVEPELRRIVEKINTHLIYPDFGGNLFLDYDDPTPENREAVLKEYESGLQNGWLAINEVREREHLPPAEGGDNLLVPFSLAPLSMVADTSEPSEPQKRVSLIVSKTAWEKKRQEKIIAKYLRGRRKYKAVKKIAQEIVKDFAETKKKRLPLTPEQKTAWWHDFDKRLTKDTKLFSILVKKLFDKQEDRIRGSLRLVEKNFKGKKKKVEIEINVNWEMEDEIFREASIPFYKDIILRNGKRAANAIGTEFKLTPTIEKFIERKAIKFAKQVNDTTEEKVKRIIAGGIKEGESITQVAERLREVVENQNRVLTIAQTETAMAINESHNEAWKQSGVVNYKEWVSVRDDDVRTSHKQGTGVDGEVIKIDGRYSNGLRFPADPEGAPEEIINCRCTEIANFDDLV